jgi:hypothetical protein
MKLTKGKPIERRNGYSRAMRTDYICDECGKARGNGDHDACSKKRQARYAKVKK